MPKPGARELVTFTLNIRTFRCKPAAVVLRSGPEMDFRRQEKRSMSRQTPRVSGSPGTERRRIVIITGLSGAGKSNALQAFEDAGYFCIDNLPPRMIPAVMETAAQGNGDPTGWSW